MEAIKMEDEKKIYREILKILKEHSIGFEEYNHDPVFTSFEASKLGNQLEEQNTKCLILKSRKNTIVVTVACNEKVDFSAIKELVEDKKTKMMSQDEIKESLGLEIGAVSPFGYSNEVLLFVSRSLFSQEFIFINPGLNYLTFKILGYDFEKVMTSQKATIL